jgi:hypothetical protein
MVIFMNINNNSGFFYSDILNAGTDTAEIKIHGVKRWLALYNCNVYWMVPAVGSSLCDIPSHTQYLLWKTEDGFGIALPLISGDSKASLNGIDGGISISIQGGNPDDDPILYIEYGKNPYELTKSAMKVVSDKLGSFKLREEKHSPEFADYLGWCTWDAFYGAVDEQKVISGLESFKNAGFPLGFMILDDGSWDAYYDYLNSAHSHPEKFPRGLKALIDDAKQVYGLKRFGVWHCFEGYWAGIKPDGELAKTYKLIENEGNIRPWEAEEHISKLYLIDPEQAEDFYEEMHSYLHSQGADMLKIDGQSAMDLFTFGKIGQGSAMKKYQQAMQKSAQKYFGGEVIHCMSNSIDVAYNMQITNCWRNSYDYAPSDMKSQREHIYINAMNAMWSSMFSLPDWDMFQSHSAGAEFHAAARAISGGPVYICDYPGKQDFDIIWRLITSDGKTLRCVQPALPSADCIFEDCRYGSKLLKIFNMNKYSGVVGVFDCSSEAKRGTVSASDIVGLNGDSFCVYSVKKRSIATASANESIEVSVGDEGYELAHFIPIVNGIAPIGLTDKFNCPAAITALEYFDGGCRIELSDGGEIGIYCKTKPEQVALNGKSIDFEYSDESGLLKINSSVTGKNTVVINTDA